MSAYGNSKLVDEQSQGVLAVLSSDPRSLGADRLDMYRDLSEPFGRIVLLTGLAVRGK